MALASSPLPPDCCCPKVVDESVRAATAAAAITNVRIMCLSVEELVWIELRYLAGGGFGTAVRKRTSVCPSRTQIAPEKLG
jgi:hypothetical protein